MADPHIKSEMDYWDKGTVIIYRTGFVIAALAVLTLPWNAYLGSLGILLAAMCCASSLHIYLKHIRLVFQFSVWIGLFCQVLGLPELALGGALLTLGGLCFKEYFCFRVPLLNLQPIFVAVLWLSIVFGQELLVKIFAFIVGVLLLLVSIRKWRMPLHFDIGDKTKYQV
ncbi:DUF2301 domain-containing membrane protein [Rodentibacter caecimuris]|uniref:Integral membrane protein n=1 Tax=Rodentibacter caecimuris TaxID=1796644 RepID=A0ABX3L3B4_9PAST|nr:hypothetical protein BKG89_01185 [Rodentibacter heylii]